MFTPSLELPFRIAFQSSEADCLLVAASIFYTTVSYSASTYITVSNCWDEIFWLHSRRYIIMTKCYMAPQK